MNPASRRPVEPFIVGAAVPADWIETHYNVGERVMRAYLDPRGIIQTVRLTRTPMPRCDGNVWNGHSFIWNHPGSWTGKLDAWLRPRLRRDAMEALRPGMERDICWDDDAWIDILDAVVVGGIEDLSEELAESLARASLRTYHGTRTRDAGTFFRDGLQVHDRERMTERLRVLVENEEELSSMRGERLAKAIAQVANDIDHGQLHVVADDTFLLDHAAHYLIYGSEWIMAVLGDEGRRVLRNHGTPTILDIDLPLRVTHPRSRYEFARVLTREWVRLTCNRTDWTAPIDFAFRLSIDIPPECIVNHRHPAELRDPLRGGRPYRPDVVTCVLCRPPG